MWAVSHQALRGGASSCEQMIRCGLRAYESHPKHDPSDSVIRCTSVTNDMSGCDECRSIWRVDKDRQRMAQRAALAACPASEGCTKQQTAHAPDRPTWSRSSLRLLRKNTIATMKRPRLRDGGRGGRYKYQRRRPALTSYQARESTGRRKIPPHLWPMPHRTPRTNARTDVPTERSARALKWSGPVITCPTPATSRRAAGTSAVSHRYGARSENCTARLLQNRRVAALQKSLMSVWASTHRRLCVRLEAAHIAPIAIPK